MKRVLVIDDDRDQLDVRRLILEHAGYEVSAARTPEHARDEFTRVKPELVIVDLHLGRGADGLALIRDFRRDRPDVKIVVMSGWPADLDGRAEKAMVDAVVPKPSRSERLLKAIAKLAMLALVVAPRWAE